MSIHRFGDDKVAVAAHSWCHGKILPSDESLVGDGMSPETNSNWRTPSEEIWLRFR